MGNPNTDTHEQTHKFSLMLLCTLILIQQCIQLVLTKFLWTEFADKAVVGQRIYLRKQLPKVPRSGIEWETTRLQNETFNRTSMCVDLSNEVLSEELSEQVLRFYSGRNIGCVSQVEMSSLENVFTWKSLLILSLPTYRTDLIIFFLHQRKY